MQTNPLGLDGIEFIEFASPDVAILENLMSGLGMTLVARHKTQSLRLFRQGDVNFVINESENSYSNEFKKRHGPSASAMGLRVADAKEAFELAVERGARPMLEDSLKGGWNLPAIYGIGDSLIYFVDQYGKNGSVYDENWQWLTDERAPKGKGLKVIDHLTNNVPRGEMQKWCDFYEKIFNFKERRYFDIKGKSTGLISKVMKSPDGKFSIPINEPSDPKSQIQEYLDEYHGSGIQHIALLTDKIIDSVSSLKAEGISFLKAPPQAYYAAIPERVPNVKEPLSPLQDLGILADGDPSGYLLQIFTKNQVGPIFVEIIQRAGHDGFGDGNFQALFDAMEEDQRVRGVL